jgi:acyl carrier protein
MDKILVEMQEIFRSVFDQPDMVITCESNSDNVENWDSLTHINLISAISQTYNVRFALGELEDLKNVGDLLELLQRKLDAK